MKERWDQIKSEEKLHSKNDSDSQTGLSHYFEQAGVERVFPASKQAYQVGKLAKKINFDWQNPDEVFDKFLSEVAELKEAWEHFKDAKEKGVKSMAADLDLRSELGDLYFSLVHTCLCGLRYHWFFFRRGHNIQKHPNE